MTESFPDNDVVAAHELGEVIAEFTNDFAAYKHYLGRKSAREVLDGAELADVLDDDTSL
jgi:hypothetical protein